MHDKAGQIADDAGNDDLVVGEREFLQDSVFVLMARVREGQHKAADIRFLQDRQDVFERHVLVVRALVIAPADMQAHAVARHVRDRPVDRVDDALDKAEKLAERAVLV